MPTYLAIPLITAASFFTAAFTAWLSVARTSPPGAVVLAVVWLALLVALLWDGAIEGAAFVAAVLTLFLGWLLAAWLYPVLGWSEALTHVLVVEAIMALLAAVNIRVRLRQRRAADGVAT